MRDLLRALALLRVLSAAFWWVLALYSCRYLGPPRPTDLQRAAEEGR
jgi:hypothetical protein